MLFNLSRITAFPVFILAEGLFDCFRVHQSGFKSVSALMGINMSKFQDKLILECFKSLVLMLDNDPAGNECTKDILNRLYDKMFVRVVKLEVKLQPDQMTEDDIQELLSFVK